MHYDAHLPFHAIRDRASERAKEKRFETGRQKESACIRHQGRERKVEYSADDGGVERENDLPFPSLPIAVAEKRVEDVENPFPQSCGKNAMQLAAWWVHHLRSHASMQGQQRLAGEVGEES